MPRRGDTGRREHEIYGKAINVPNFFRRILQNWGFTNDMGACYNQRNIQIEARASSVPDGIRSGSGRTGKGRPPKRRGVPDCSLLGRLRISAGLSQRQRL